MAIAETSFYQTKSAVLFLIFNRPSLTKHVFEQIKKARPARLYVAADGPRANYPDDVLCCKQAREIIKDVDWRCEVKTLFRESNAGCKEAVSGAIAWFFEQETEGIILEDDCVPANSFFKFCDELLAKYRFEERVRHIAGANFQYGKQWGDGSYYFSNITHVWGWATWRRAWNHYEKDLSNYNEAEAKETLTKLFANPLITAHWLHLFSELKAGKIDTWDYQLGFANYFNHGLCIIPNVNLVTNIGFGYGATHTKQTDGVAANIPLGELTEIVHPLGFEVQKQADQFSLSADLNANPVKAKQKNIFSKTASRLKKWLAVFK